MSRVDEGGVAEIVRHHDGWVQTGEIQRTDRLLMESSNRLEDRRTLVSHLAVVLATYIKVRLQKNEV